jgi:hypothetical protein
MVLRPSAPIFRSAKRTKFFAVQKPGATLSADEISLRTIAVPRAYTYQYRFQGQAGVRVASGRKLILASASAYVAPSIPRFISVEMVDVIEMS